MTVGFGGCAGWYTHRPKYRICAYRKGGVLPAVSAREWVMYGRLVRPAQPGRGVKARSSSSTPAGVGWNVQAVLAGRGSGDNLNAPCGQIWASISAFRSTGCTPRRSRFDKTRYKRLIVRLWFRSAWAGFRRQAATRYAKYSPTKVRV